MTTASTDSGKTVRTLEAEESMIESKVFHQGFADASRRNRIDEQLDVLGDAARRGKHHLPDPEQIDHNTKAEGPSEKK